LQEASFFIILNISIMPPNQYSQSTGTPGTPPAAGANHGHKKIPLWFILVFTVAVLALIGSGVFGFWAFSNMKDYKENCDEISATAVEQAKEEQKTQLEAQFAEAEKSPLKSYTSPSQFGSVKIVYPKTWSAYISEQSDGNTPVDGYFYPDFVPGVDSSEKANYSLRVQVLNNSYGDETRTFESSIEKGELKAEPFAPEQVEGATAGLRLNGQITKDNKGAMIVVPLRDKVLKIWTEDEGKIADFNNIVLKNLTYSP
jgi:hypothetical protein